MTYTASDVPGRIDVLIDGQGYRFLETDEVKGISSFAPTFLQRTNVSDAYGDEDQDWWLTMTQRDWSLGEGQRYLTAADQESQRRYWDGSTVDVNRVQGEATLGKDQATLTFGSAVYAVYGATASSEIMAAGATNLFTVDAAGTITDKGAHGVGATPSANALTADGGDAYISNNAGVVRKWTGAAFSTFSATGCDSLAILNNTLYGYSDATGALLRYSTAGAASTIFTWQGADGAFEARSGTVLRPYGGDLLILRRKVFGLPGELWLYDGVAPAIIDRFPQNFAPLDAAVVGGVALVSGVEVFGATLRPMIRYWKGGETGVLWQGRSTTTTVTFNISLCEWAQGAAWTDEIESKLYHYNPETGAVTTLATISGSQTENRMASSGFHLVRIRTNSTAAVRYPTSSVATTGYTSTSLVDGDTTRTKRFKSVVVEWVAATDGDGGSVDIAYRLNDVDGSYTSVQTGAVSGTEYAIGQNGRAISIKVTLNKGTSTLGPKLKRIYVRAAPLLDTFRKERYVLDLTGVDGEQHLQMRDGITVHPKDGLQMATDLRTAIASTTPVTIVDEFGSYSAYLVPEECEIRRVRSQEYTAVITARQV